MDSQSSNYVWNISNHFIILFMKCKLKHSAGSCDEDVCRASLQHFRHNLVYHVSFAEVPWLPENKPARNSTTDKQEVCLGYDGKGYAPVGCYVIKDNLITLVVIHK
jgi:hypothetical protein